MTPCQYVVVRADLPNRTKYSMINHASGEAASGGPKLPKTTVGVVLGVRDQSELLAVAEVLAGARIPHNVIIEDHGLFAGQAMSIGIDPWVAREAVKAVLGHLESLK